MAANQIYQSSDKRGFNLTFSVDEDDWEGDVFGIVFFGIYFVKPEVIFDDEDSEYDSDESELCDSHAS